MIHQDIYDALLPWQKAFVNREALSICRDNKAYRILQEVVESDDHEAAVYADSACVVMRGIATDSVMEDSEFMESITVADEDRYCTRWNSNAR